MATASSSSREKVQTRNMSSSNSSVRSRSSISRRLADPTEMCRSSFSLDTAKLPEIGERTIYVTDEGMIDSGEFDQLASEFEHRLGLLPEEQQELSEVFKVRIGLATEDREQVDRLANEMDSAMSAGGQQREDAMRRNHIDNFARRHFQPGSPPVQYTAERLRKSLLVKNSTVERRASLAIWIAILRFVDGSTARKHPATSKILKAPIISQVWDLLEMQHDPTQQTERLRQSSRTAWNDGSGRRRLSLKKFFQTVSRRTSSRQSDEQRASTSLEEPQNDDSSLVTSAIIAGIPLAEIDIVSYIAAHGILSKRLRDEIYCQLCCVVTKNPSVESRRRGWMLHLLCAGCFLPSIEFLSYYYAFLYERHADDDQRYANFTRRTLRRTNSNGTRFHPPSMVELAAAKNLRSMQLDVSIPDGRTIKVNVDSASTASEICDMIAANINIKDSFGFSVHITVNDKISSLGSGLDHVMDAITESEQLVRTQGKVEPTDCWRLFYRKELFTPWYNPSLDQVATELIYQQIIDSVYNDDYRLHDDDVVTYVARCLYVEFGRNLQPDMVKSKMSKYFPVWYYGNSNRARDALARAVMASFVKQGFNGYAVPAKYIQHELVASASEIWPTHFSAMFEAYCIEGPRLPCNELILAINSCGIFLLDVNYQQVIVGLHFYDIIYVTADTSTDDIRDARIDLLAVDGAEFKLLCPNAETIARIVAVFLDGLKRRSRWAIALDQSSVPVQEVEILSSQRLHMRAGDLVELLESDDTSSPSTPSSRDESRDVQILYGRNERSGKKGSFFDSCVYVLPTMEKPVPDFISLLKKMSRATMETLPHVHHPTLAIARTTHDHSAA